MKIARHRLRTGIVVSGIVVIALLFVHKSPKSRPSEKEVAAAEDEVYEALVRHMVSPGEGTHPVGQLVFADTLYTPLKSGEDAGSCKKRARKRFSFSLEIGPPLYDSPADKVYRLFVHGDYDEVLRADTETISDFLEKLCMVGRVSQNFHTDLPRTFIGSRSVHFYSEIVNDGSKSFEQLYPGAFGIISFSRVGFDSTLHQAIVFECGLLCGSGYRYVLRKKSGRWEVVEELRVWVY